MSLQQSKQRMTGLFLHSARRTAASLLTREAMGLFHPAMNHENVFNNTGFSMLLGMSHIHNTQTPARGLTTRKCTGLVYSRRTHTMSSGILSPAQSQQFPTLMASPAPAQSSRFAGSVRNISVGPTREREKELWEQGVGSVAGVSYSGRGAFAGPVVAAAVILPHGEEYVCLYLLCVYMHVCTYVMYVCMCI
jgi:hypothetical protein